MDGQIYIPAGLQNLSQQYRNTDTSYIQDVVAPVFTVPRRTGLYAYYPKNLTRPTNTLRTGKEKTPEDDFSVQWKNFGPLQEHALKGGIEKDVLEQAQDPLDPMFDTTRNLLDKMMIDREVNLSATLSNTSIVTQYAVVSVQWNASTGSGSPFIDITTGVNTMQLNGLRPPNTVFMGYPVWLQLSNHPDLLDRVKYSSLGVLTQELFSTILAPYGINRVVVASAVYNSAAEGLTSTNGYIFGKNLWLAYVTPNPALRTLNGMYTFVKENGRYVDGWPSLDKKTTWLRVNDYYEQILVGPEAFYLIQGAVA